jgi:transcriptional regulator with XRE-family HTH domain
VETGIGATLRKARKRRKIDLSEVASATKIRPGFLRAMENEDWDVLPGGSYTRSFIRTYAAFLGLDGERLAEEYRRASGEPHPGERGAPRADPVVASSSPQHGPSLPRGAWAAIVSVLLIVILVVVGLSGEERDGTSGRDSGMEAGKPPRAQRSASQVEGSKPGVSVRLAANAEVWVCLLDAGGQGLINGQVLLAGAEEGPFRSDSFTLSFGNGEVSMWIDGQQASIPETPSPVGYEIDESGELTPLSEVERPTCT